MTIYFRPVGRGNWAEDSMEVASTHLLALWIRVGATFALGDVQFRVTRVVS